MTGRISKSDVAHVHSMSDAFAVSALLGGGAVCSSIGSAVSGVAHGVGTAAIGGARFAGRDNIGKGVWFVKRRNRDTDGC
jgi:hypothetical protein